MPPGAPAGVLPVVDAADEEAIRLIGLIDVVAARRRLRPHLRPTPLLHAPALSRLLERPVYLKPENLQATGSFKARGALNLVLQLPPAQRQRGLLAASAGNHGQGVALAARLTGVPAAVVVPDVTPQTKLQAMRDLGAEVEIVPGGYNGAYARASERAAAEGATLVPSFDDERVLAGQGTVALEVVEELPDVAAILTPVGSGGLCGGMGAVTRAPGSRVRLIGVQSELTPGMYRSLAAGRVVPVDEPRTLCEGLSGDVEPAALALARQVLDGMELVPEAAVAEAVRWLVAAHRQIAEGSGAVGPAAILHAPVRERIFGPDGPAAGDGPVVAVITGGNIDMDVLAGLLQAKA